MNPAGFVFCYSIALNKAANKKPNTDLEGQSMSLPPFGLASWNDALGSMWVSSSTLLKMDGL